MGWLATLKKMGLIMSNFCRQFFSYFQGQKKDGSISTTKLHNISHMIFFFWNFWISFSPQNRLNIHDQCGDTSLCDFYIMTLVPTMILTPYFSDSTNYLTFGHGLQVGNTFWLLTPLSAQDTGNSLQTLSLSLKTNIHFIKWVKVLRLRL